MEAIVHIPFSLEKNNKKSALLFRCQLRYTNINKCMCFGRAPAVLQACAMISSAAFGSQDPFPVHITLDTMTLATLSLSLLD